MPTTLPSLGSLQSDSRKPTSSGSSDEGIVALDINYGVSPDGRDFYTKHQQNGRQGWRQLNPNDPKDRELIARARQILSQIPRGKLKEMLSNAFKNAQGREVLEKVQRKAGEANFNTTKADELAAKFGVPKPRSKDPGPQPNNSSSFSATGALQSNVGDLDANQGSTNTSFDKLNSPESQLADKSQTSLPSSGSSGESWGDLSLDSDVQANQTKLPYQPKPDGGSQLPPLGSLRDDSYPKDSWGNDTGYTNDGFPENNRAQEEPDRERYRPQWREEGDSREEYGDNKDQSGELGNMPNRQLTSRTSGLAPGGDGQQPNQSLGSRINAYKDKMSRFAKNFGGSGQSGSLANKVGQAANRASQTLQKAKQAAQTAQKAAQTAKQAAQVAKLGARVGVQLIRLILPLLVPLLKILLIILIVILLLIIIVAAVGSVLKPINDIISGIGSIFGGPNPPPTERSKPDQDVSVDSFITYIKGFDFEDRPTNFKRNGEQKFNLLPKEDGKVQSVMQLISNDASLRFRINRLLHEGVYIATNELINPPPSGLNILDPSVSNRIILRIAWMWVENDWRNEPPSLGPDWYLYNCADQDAPGGPANVSPKKWDLSGHCRNYSSGKHQVAGFQLFDKRRDISTAYQFCFKKEFPNGAGQIMQENFNYSSDATRDAWKYTNPVYQGKLVLGDLNREFFRGDFYPACETHECEARTQLLVKHPCMAMYLNTAADTWEGFDGSRGGGNAQAIVSALHYYILDLKAGAS